MLSTLSEKVDPRHSALILVDVQNDFAETYEVIEGKEKVLEELKSAAKKADEVLLATDPDREGEAIAFHISEEIKNPKLKVARVEFHEITKKGVDHGVHNPRKLDENLYDAQRARRVLDRIVGYDVSALVWSKLAFGLSAGRVQSVALRLIVDREREIRAFDKQEYWTIDVSLAAQKPPVLKARLAKRDGANVEIASEEASSAIVKALDGTAYTVRSVGTKEKKRNPVPPFITSTLQQDAARKLRFSVKRTMGLAQRLYEGVELGSDGSVGLITYIRTDSTRVSDDAVNDWEAAAVHGARVLADRIVATDADLVLAGAGVANLATWLAMELARARGSGVQLTAELGLVGYEPTPADPFVFNHRAFPSATMLAGADQVLGALVPGPGTRTLAGLGAAQIDAAGNVNSTVVPGSISRTCNIRPRTVTTGSTGEARPTKGFAP